ncbi:MAG: homoserine kinase [Endomicrobiales bacterium]|nr:homoserine kinase [Endomicrobiales bacterium]
MRKYFKVKIPATISNLGPGFDCYGAALSLYNEIDIIAGKKKKASFKIDIEGEGEDKLPRNENNIVWKAIKRVLDIYGKRKSFNNFYLKIVNSIPIASGLGSSAAARLGGILAAYGIIGRRINFDEILPLAVKMEGHPDNAVPALAGGLCISILNKKGIKYIKLNPPKMKVVLCVPYFEVSTEKARKILPKKVLLQDAVFNISHSAIILAAIIKKNYEMLGMGMKDKLHQPYRKKLVPGLERVISSAEKAGAYGSSLSGAGPSVLSFCPINKAEKVGKSMMQTWKKMRINSRYFILDFDSQGAKIFKR